MSAKLFKSLRTSLAEFVKFSLSFSKFDEVWCPAASLLDTDERADDKLWYLSSLESFFGFSFSSDVKSFPASSDKRFVTSTLNLKNNKNKENFILIFYHSCMSKIKIF